jgi:hypothetical protein
MRRYALKLLSKHSSSSRRNLREKLREFSSSRSRVSGFLSGLTYETNGLSFEENYDLLKEIPTEEIEEWERGHFKDHGQRVVYGSKDVSVIDTNMKSDWILRSLHFNDRVDLRQSAVMRYGEIYDYTSSPCNHVKTLSMGLAVNDSLNSNKNKKIVVLGGGGCVLPAFIHKMFPKSRIRVVERSQEIVHVAQKYFGISQLESDRFELICDCAKNWISRQDQESIDVLMIDIEGGVPEREDWILPPLDFVSKPFLDPAVLSKASGILCLKTIASRDAFQEIIRSVRGAGFDSVIECAIPDTVRERVAFCASSEHGKPLDLRQVRKSIRNMYSEHFNVDSWAFSYAN